MARMMCGRAKKNIYITYASINVYYINLEIKRGDIKK